MTNISLRDTTENDLDLYFEQQLDEDSNYMAAFTAEDPSDKAAFMAHWAKILSNDSIVKRAILVGDTVVGHIDCFELFGEQSIGYWIGKQYWGKGIATKALSLFLKELTIRPLYARIVNDNIGSLRVLEKNGFKIIGADKGFAHARGEEVEEYILELIAEK